MATPEVASGLLASPLNHATCSSFSQRWLTSSESRNAARAAPWGVTTCAAAQAACEGKGQATVQHFAGAGLDNMDEGHHRGSNAGKGRAGTPRAARWQQAAGRKDGGAHVRPPQARRQAPTSTTCPNYTPLAHLLGWSERRSAARPKGQQHRCPACPSHVASCSGQ